MTKIFLNGMSDSEFQESSSPIKFDKWVFCVCDIDEKIVLDPLVLGLIFRE